MNLENIESLSAWRYLREPFLKSMSLVLDKKHGAERLLATLLRLAASLHRESNIYGDNAPMRAEFLELAGKIYDLALRLHDGRQEKKIQQMVDSIFWSPGRRAPKKVQVETASEDPRA